MEGDLGRDRCDGGLTEAGIWARLNAVSEGELRRPNDENRLQDATRKQGDMKYSIGSMVDIAGTPWEITKEFGEYLILEHRDGNRVTVPKAMFGPDPGSPQVGDVWLFTPTAEGGGVAYSQGYVQIIGTQDTMNRWPVVYVAERHPEQARLGRFYVWREELVEKAELRVASCNGGSADRMAC